MSALLVVAPAAKISWQPAGKISWNPAAKISWNPASKISWTPTAKISWGVPENRCGGHRHARARGRPRDGSAGEPAHSARSATRRRTGEGSREQRHPEAPGRRGACARDRQRRRCADRRHQRA